MYICIVAARQFQCAKLPFVTDHITLGRHVPFYEGAYHWACVTSVCKSQSDAWCQIREVQLSLLQCHVCNYLRSFAQVFEPSELERLHFTDADQEIRTADMPERFQLRRIPVCPTEEGELEDEAEWIYKQVSCDTNNCV